MVLLALYLTHALAEDPPFLRRLKRGGIRVDYIGISMLALGVGSLQIVLDKGQEDDWFGSHFITTLVITATVCLISLVIWEWFRKEPIIDVRMFKSFNFAAANLMMFMMGFMLLSTLVLIPEFLQTLMGLYSRACRSRPVRRRSCFAADDAHRWPACVEDSGPMPDRDGMAVPCHWTVLLRAPD